MSNWVEVLNEYSNKDLEQRKVWYSPVVEAYDRARPRYPKQLIQRIVEVARLAPRSKILEVGCGSGVATVDFARLGYSIDAVEPNLEFCRLAEQHCSDYPQVRIIPQTFEEWQVEPGKFQIVLAANAWHWISSDIKYVKASEALQKNGALVLLWNMSLEPSYEVYQVLNEVYQQFAPSVAPKYEGKETQEEILQGLGKLIGDSGLFGLPVQESIECDRVYDTERYLSLLSSYSQYIALEPTAREALFAGLRTVIDRQFEGELQLFNLAAYQIAKKL
ncbi:class I SAM-dependent methyltransferase [Leptolyngbya sp. NIES-2104]|uniref:class I SAM-dependent methyltransferase n=1 Tax=Leptolyngbya sp. NIES-2104 TaxID=1552121 RepID=UPI0006ECC4EE|nr:class I SAM-dependent methyltransferase [Leptolyngbya sp. NIES-2104]GAP94949.1 methyltransferase [Leptolyngbya sp. NIES-2104]